MRCSALVATALATAACDRPSPLVICHNTNCAGPDVTRDDSLPALAESLTVSYAGRPAIDGIEWDTFWYGAESRCLFAHDLKHDTSTPALAAAQAIGDYLAGTDQPSWNAERFYVFIELKANVGPSLTDAHTAEQRDLHAECALDALDVIVAGARTRGHALTVGFVSAVPAQHEALIARPRWASYTGATDLELMLVGDIFGPYSSVVPELADYKTPIGAVEFHPDFMTVQHREAYRSLGIDLVQWSFVTTTEAFDSIERWEPRYVLTNEAVLLRRWIER